MGLSLISLFSRRLRSISLLAVLIAMLVPAHSSGWLGQAERVLKSLQRGNEPHAHRGAATAPALDPQDLKLPPATGDFSGCEQFFFDGRAPVLPAPLRAKTQALCFKSFAVMYSGATRTPLYAVERLNRRTIIAARGVSRPDGREAFFPDPRLKRGERSELSDFKGAVNRDLPCDRGHLVPAADQADEEAMASSFALSNVVCQAPKANRSSWSAVEADTRKYIARAAGDVYVITGTVFDTDARAGRTRRPSHLFKLVFDPNTNRAWAHFQPNSDSARMGPPISYDELRRRTGIDFFPGHTPSST